MAAMETGKLDTPPVHQGRRTGETVLAMWRRDAIVRATNGCSHLGYRLVQPATWVLDRGAAPLLPGYYLTPSERAIRSRPRGS